MWLQERQEAMKGIDEYGLKGMRRWNAAWKGLAAFALAAMLAPLAAQAQDGAPARAARLSYSDGQVTVSQGGQVLAQQAAANTPLFEGMQVATGSDGKAEIQFDDGSVARLSPNSAATLTILRGDSSNGETEIALTGGLGYFELQGGSDSGQMSVRFGDSVATASGFAVFRIDMDTPPGSVAVFSGNAHLEGGNGALDADLHGGESVTLNGSDPGNYSVAESIEPDSWDAWNSDRDQAMTTEAAQETGAPADLADSSNPAWNDMSANGNWYDVPDQGYVWSPYVASSAGWDPYGCGQWMWTPRFGYIWVSCYNWGYMPYMAGSWNYYDGFGWGWSMGYGGYNPWWNTGYYGGPNIGYAPGGYSILQRPNGPRRPDRLGMIPTVPVKRPPLTRIGRLAGREGNGPVTIGGHTVQPLRPMPGRTSGARQSNGFAGRPQPTYPVMGTGTRANGGDRGARPVYGTGRQGAIQQPRGAQGGSYVQPSRGFTPPPNRTAAPERGRTYTPPSRTNSPPPNRTYSPPPSRTNSPAPSRTYSPPPSRPSGGGGGGFSGGHSGGGAPAPHGGGNQGGGHK